MRETSLVYIVKDGKVLMLHRIRKKNDENHGKWIGVGGKFEQGECPEDCMRRETFEETGLLIDQYRYCGIVTFQNDSAETEFMHLFLVTEAHPAEAEMQETACQYSEKTGNDCPEKGKADPVSADAENAATASSGISTREGDLQWLPQDMLTQIPHWPGDRIFLSLIFAKPEVPFFSLKLVYRNGDLIHASLNEHNCLVTDRLILRPFLDRDAEALYEQAKNPEIGLPAGWPPHRSPQDSLRVIRDTLKRPEIYAIVRRDTGDPVGAIGLQNFHVTDDNGGLISYYDERKSCSPVRCTTPEAALRETLTCSPDTQKAAGCRPSAQRAGAEEHALEGICFQAELGYWLGEDCQGRGLMTEAAREVIRHGFENLGLSGIWCAHFRGNEASAAVQKRLGFHFHHENETVQVPLLGEVRSETVNVMWKEDFDRLKNKEMQKTERPTSP